MVSAAAVDAVAEADAAAPADVPADAAEGSDSKTRFPHWKCRDPGIPRVSFWYSGADIELEKTLFLT